MTFLLTQLALSLLVLHQIQLISSNNDCKTHYSGICVSKNEKCPFVNAKEVKSTPGRRDLCHDSDKPRRCCVPPKKSPVYRRNEVCGQRQVSRSRIVGGHPSDLGKWPWQVGLITLMVRNVSCGGSIIHPEWILTAGHCVDENEQGLMIVAGDITKNSSGKHNQIVPVKNIYHHKLFDISGTVPNDIALLKLKHKIKLGPHVNTVCLPNVEEDFENMFCTATGFGSLEYRGMDATVLYEVDLPIISPANCAKMHKKIKSVLDPNFKFPIYYEHLCAAFQSGERSSCKGDSGGPFVCLKKNFQNIAQFVQAGIVSWGANGCATPGTATVFTRVTKYLEWIEFITKLPFFDGSYANNHQKQYIYKNVTLVPV